MELHFFWPVCRKDLSSRLVSLFFGATSLRGWAPDGPVSAARLLSAVAPTSRLLFTRNAQRGRARNQPKEAAKAEFHGCFSFASAREKPRFRVECEVRVVKKSSATLEHALWYMFVRR